MDLNTYFMKPLEIIMFNMSSFSEWQKGVVNRNFHIFRGLARRPEVERIIAVDFLPFTFRRVLRNFWENILKTTNYKSGTNIRITNIYWDLTTKCVKISGLYPAEVYVFSTIDSIFSHQKVIDKINKILEKISQATKQPSNQATRIVWSYFPMFVEYFGRITADLTVFDAVDNWIEHPSYARYKNLLENNYKIIAQKSDIIFTVAESLVDFFKSLGREKDTYWVANGVEPEHFAETPPLPKNDLILGIPRPIIGYVGTIQNRIDINLLEYLAQKNPNKSFVLIGPLWPVFLRKLRRPTTEIKKLKKYKNIYLLGRRPYALTPAYIKTFDVAIIPHKLDKFIKYTDSLKALEYLACGVPIVTTPPSGVERFSHLIHIAQDYQDFSHKIDLALTNDTIELKRKRIEQMKEEDWRLKIEEMMKHIK